MDSRDLTPEQRERLREFIWRDYRRLGALKRRLEKLHFHEKDPLTIAVKEAWDAYHKLAITVHYMSCAEKTAFRLGPPMPPCDSSPSRDDPSPSRASPTEPPGSDQPRDPS